MGILTNIVSQQRTQVSIRCKRQRLSDIDNGMDMTLDISMDMEQTGTDENDIEFPMGIMSIHKEEATIKIPDCLI